MADVDAKVWDLVALEGVESSADPFGQGGDPPPDPASWNLPATINVPQSGSVGVRQYLTNGADLTISVTNLPTGVTYNSGTESLEGAAAGTSSGTATFTAGAAVDTATVALVEGGVWVPPSYGGVTHVVSPTATVNGTGSEASPFTWQQARAFTPNGNHAHLEWLPGRAQVTPSYSQYGSLRPLGVGTSQNPYIWSGRFDPRTGDPASHTQVGIPEGTYGTQMGFGDNNGPDAGGVNRHFVLSKFRIDESNGIDGSMGPVGWPGENASISIRGHSQHIKIDRCLLGQGNKQGPFHSNANIIFSHYSYFVEITDNVFHLHANAHHANQAAIEVYDINDWDIHHNHFANDLGNNSVFLKGQHAGPGASFFRVRIHHNLDEARYGVNDYNYFATTEIANGVWIYQNIMRNAGHAFSHNPAGTVFANNLILSSRLNFWWQGTPGDYPQRMWNNIIAPTSAGAMECDQAGGLTAESLAVFVADYNLWRTGMTVTNTGQTFAFWQSQGKDPNGAQVDCAYDPTTYAPQAGSPQINAGRDFLQLLGGADTAPINVGPYIQAGDVFGPRGM